MARPTALVALTLAAIGMTAHATGDCPEVVGRRVGTGVVSQVALDGGIALFTNGGLLEVADVSDPNQPQLLAELVLPTSPWRVWDIELDGSTALVTMGDAGVMAVDLSEPAQPEVLWRHDFGSFVYDVATFGDYLLVAADFPLHLGIYDRSTGGVPELVSRYEVHGAARAVVVAGDTAYVTCTWRVSQYGYLSELHAIDLSDPRQPSRVDVLPLGNFSRGLAVTDRNVYLGVYDELWVIRIANPMALDAVQVIEQTVADSVITRDDLIIVAEPHVVVYRELDVLNDPLVELARIRAQCYDVAVSGDMLLYGVTGNSYFGEPENGVVLVDLSDPGQPKELGSYATPSRTFALATTTVAGHLALGLDDRIELLDVSDRSRPRVVGSVPAPDGVHALAALESHLLATDERVGLRVIDVANARRPDEIARLATPGEALDVARVGPAAACIADGPEGVLCVDLSDPGDPVAVASLPSSGSAESIDSDWHLGAVIDSVEGLVVIDVSTVDEPRYLASRALPGAELVTLWGGSAFVGRYGSVSVFDLGDPTDPVLLEPVLPASGSILGMAVSGGHAVLGVQKYITSYYYRTEISVLDLQRPFEWAEIGWYEAAGLPQDLDLAGTALFSASHAGGLEVLALDGCASSAPEADFSWWPEQPGIGQPVRFADASYGLPESRLWLFGDGMRSDQENPVHAFASPGFYTVSLTVSNALGSDTTTRTLTVVPRMRTPSGRVGRGMP